MADQKKTKGVKNKTVSSSSYAVLKIIAGFLLTVTGCAMLMGVLFNEGGAFKPFRDLALGLSGLGGVCFSLLTGWLGVLILVSAYRPVSFRGCLLAIGFFISVCCIVDSLSVIKGSSTRPDYGYVDEIIMQGNYWKGLATAWNNGVRAIQFGMLSMMVAYPLNTMGRLLAVFIAALAALVFLLAFFRTNPINLFNRVSDFMEDRRKKKPARPEKQTAAVQTEQAQPANYDRYRPSAAYNTAAMPSAVPLYRGATVQPAAPRTVPPAQPEAEFYDDVAGDDYALYADVPFRTETEYAPQPPAAVPQMAGNSHAYASKPAAYAYHGASVPAAGRPVNPAVQAGYSGEDIYPEERSEIEPYAQDAEVAPLPEEKPFAGEKKAAASPVRATVPAPEKKSRRRETVPEKEEPQVWDVPQEDTEVLTPVQPVAEEPVYPPVAQPQTAEEPRRAAADPSGWADLVRARRQQLDKPKMAMDDKPVPVYTDAVMPIGKEKIAIVTQTEGVPADRAGIDGRDKQKAGGIQIEMNMPVQYQAPPITLMREGDSRATGDTGSEDEMRARIIVDTLASFKIQSEMRQITHGPAITRFAIQIAPGIRVGQVTGASENIGLNLGTNQIRVEAPIQGTNYIGIEVPNKRVNPVLLRQVLDSPEMRNNTNPLVVALGKDIAGTPITCNLSKMPHLLIAGATGSGKSVCINSIVCSLIYRATPSQVRLIMVDPKQVELQVYNGIPHLLTPVVVDPKKAAGALNWVVNEMTERYAKFSASKVRNLEGYNKLKEGTEEVLPNIVVIIDEMADLMDVCRKDVEESIRRLAALARAAGIYMVLATQRPSVDVITGVIKNNIPSRIAFMVSSATDSRTILDMGGAEKLVGRGDMLYKPAGASAQRVQGCFVTDDEVGAVTDYVSSRFETNYDVNIQEQLDNISNSTDDEVSGDADTVVDDDSDGGLDAMLPEAILMAVQDGQASTSMLQRRLRVGYARAGRLIDEMEKRGIISRSEGSKPRKTLMTRQQYAELYGKNPDDMMLE